MEKACYGRRRGPEVTPQRFHELATSNYKELGRHPYCPQCSEIVDLYGIHNWAVSRFDHKDRGENFDPLDDCPLAHREGNRFLGMKSDGWNYERGDRLREAFFEDENLRMAYAFCRNLTRTGNVPAAKFRSMIRRADKKQIWSYADIPLWIIPYILLTLENFIQKPSSKSKGYEFHFVFNKPRGSTASALWNRGVATSLNKIFSANGEAVKSDDNPFPISEDQMRAKAGAVAWITDDFLQDLRRAA